MRERALVSLALLTFGCAETPPQDAAPDPATVATPEPEPGIRVLDAGAEPRALLRSLPVGRGREQRRMTLVLTGEQIQGQVTGLLNAPPVLLDLELRRDSTDGLAAELRFTGSPFTLGSAELVDPNVIVAMQAALDDTRGFTGTALIDGSHALEELTFQHPDANNSQAQQLAASYAQTLAQVHVRWPDEPVGVGARWNWTSTHRSTIGALFEQETTATLLESSGGNLRVSLESSFQASRHFLSGPPVPEGMTIDVTVATGNSTAELSFRPDEILPTRADALAHWKLKLITDRAGIAEEVNLLQDMRLALETP